MSGWSCRVLAAAVGLVLVVACVNVVPAAHAGSLYAVDGWGDSNGWHYLATVDRATGEQTLVGPYSTPLLGSRAASGLAHRVQDDALYLIDRSPAAWDVNGLYRIDRHTGASTRISPSGAFDGLDPWGLAHDAANDIMYSTTGSEIISVDLNSGLPLPVAPMINFAAVDAIAYDNDAGLMYALGGMLGPDGRLLNGDRLISFDPTAPIGTSVIDFGTGNSFRGLTWDPESNVLWTHDTINGELISIDPASGVVQSVGSTVMPGFGGSALHLAHVIPTPGGFAVLAIAASLISCRRR